MSLCCLSVHECRAIDRNMASFSETMSVKKTDSISSGSQTMPIAPHLMVKLPILLPLPWWDFVWLIIIQIFLHSWMTYHCIYVPYFSIHPSLSRHIGCFHFLTVVNRAATNMNEHVSLGGYSLWNIYQRDNRERPTVEKIEE